MSENNGFKGFLRSIFGRTQESEREPEDQVQELELKTSEKPPQANPFEDAGRLPPLKGSLLQVWRMWSDSLPPILSLTLGLDIQRLQLDEHQLEREKVRLTVQLEQDAKKRVQEIENAKKNGISALDARCQVYISRDKMIAWLFMFPPFGKTGTVSMEGIANALQTNNVTTGILTSAVLYAYKEKAYYELIPIALGTPAVQGTDGNVTEHFERALPFEVKVDEYGMADYKSSNYVRQVMKDDVICDISLPVPGQSGLRIDGTVVEPKAVKAARVPKGANTMVTEDGLQLIATMDGHLEYTNQAFHVRAVLNITGDVDYEIGNINFVGDVHIKGDVRENFSVVATGSVTVDGLVEAASIDAGGDLLVTKGVVGDNRALIRSKGCIRAKYLENCVVYAGKGIYADCIMNSQVFSDKCVDVYSGRGSIIGGAVTAAEGIRAKMIGAASGRRTELTLGVLPYIQNELHNIQGDIAANRHEKEELEKQLAYLERHQGIEGSDARVAKARMRKSVLEMKEQQLLKRQEKLEPMMPDIAKCRLECDAIYPVTVLTVQDATWVAKEVKKRCRVVYDVREGTLKEVY